MAGDKALTTSKVVSSIIQQVSSVAPARDRPQSPAYGGWSSPDSLLTKLFAGEPTTIAIAFLITITLPVLLHLYFYTSAARASKSGVASDGVPTFLLLGPSGSGKTSLVTLLQRRVLASTTADNEGEKPEPVVNGNGHVAASSTRLSQTASTIGMRLPAGTPLGSNKYRSENDFEVTAAKVEGAKYKIIDTPGHSTLR